ncbi:hypothetical protein MMC34_003861 [Xylographa carneopallida]|nr:hypothetical protein [Xylographa carneopallida]
MPLFSQYITSIASGRCTALASPSYINFGISIFILLGILASYLSQYHRIIVRRSSEGISPYFLLLGTTAGTCAFANILVLPASRADLACCKDISGFACFASLLGILQVGLVWSCFAGILLLFLIFFPRATALAPLEPLNSTPSYREALGVAGISAAHAVITTIISAVIVTRYPEHLQAYANGLGLLATVLASIQYFPQIFTTWRLKHVGSLSIPMMCIQTPGSFVWAGSLFARVGWQGWSTWFIYVVTGILQGIVLGLGIFFELRNRKRRKEDESGGSLSGEDDAAREEEASAPSEATPLLGNK